MRPAVRNILLSAPFSPYRLSGNAARYSLDGPEGDETYLTNGLGRVRLVADRSGNSATNALVLNGVSGNSATVPDSAATSPTTAVDVKVRCSFADWTPAAAESIAGKWNPSRAYTFNLAIGGALVFVRSTDGTSGTAVTATSSVANSIADFAKAWVRVTYDGASGDTKFYTAPDSDSVPSVWTQLGTTQTITAGNIFDSTDTAAAGKGNTSGGNSFNVYRWIVANSIDGSAAIDVDFTLFSKLATTGTATTGQTVTINTSGDSGARICGVRDLYQGTTSKMPLLSVSGGYNIATFDGSNDFMKAAAFSYSQPETVYFVGSQVTWTAARAFFDGNDLETMNVDESPAASSPSVQQYSGSYGGRIATDWAVGATGVVCSVFNGSSSSLRLNRGSANTGDASTRAGGGFTLGSKATAAAPANMTFSEALLYSTAHDAATQLKVSGAEMRKWGIS